jgi:hypothetical protein
MNHRVYVWLTVGTTLTLVSDEPPPSDQLSLRISNEDRERVAQILHNAMAEGRIDLNELEERLDTVYAAKTFADLEPVTKDLPVRAPRPAAVAHPQPHQPSTRVGGAPGPTKSIAVMSGVDRKGPWVVPEHHQVVAVMGGVVLDLTEARFAAREVTINAFAFWGGVEIYVPEDITVHVDGFGFMGAFEDKTFNTATPGAPVVRITGFAMMAGVEVKYPKDIRRRRKHLPESGH